ncbi:MAG: glycerol-3-phosphate dehydrogenase C-terminal domain-containing protein, partial [Ginsengibacter sp.]
WYQNVIVGTTDTPLQSHSLEPRALESEVEFVLNTAGKYLSKPPNKRDVLSVFAGLRPLAATDDSKEKTKEISRSHKVIISKSGLVSVIGGKWTTYRKMAEDTLSKIMNSKMLPWKTCITQNLAIHGYTSIKRENDSLSFYGADEAGIEKLVDENVNWGIRIIEESTIIPAQVIWAVRNEMARTIEDFLARRTRILFIDARLAIRLAADVAEIMKVEMNKDENWKESQVSSFTKLAKGYLVV